MTEAYTDQKNQYQWYGNEQNPISDVPINYASIALKSGNISAEEMSRNLNDYFQPQPFGVSGNLILGNHDINRVASRFSNKSVDAFNTLLLATPAIPIIYYGEEIGMEDNPDIKWEETLDPQYCWKNSTNSTGINRDVVRTPFQWNDETSAGFSTSQITWIAVNANYKYLNLENQKYNPGHLAYFRSLLYFREDYKIYDMNISDFQTIGNILAYSLTSYTHNYRFLILINFDSDPAIFNASESYFIPTNVNLGYILGSCCYKSGTTNEFYEPFESVIFIYETNSSSVTPSFPPPTNTTTPTWPSTASPEYPYHGRENKTVVFLASQSETEYRDGEINISNFGIYFNKTRILTG